jgi:signal transduction histidine kinase
MYDQFLRNVSLLADLPDEELNRLCHVIGEVKLAPGEVLFEEGSQPDRTYILHDGVVEIIRQIDGREVLINVSHQPGTVIGEMAMLAETPRLATVRARQETSLLYLDHDWIHDLMSLSPTAARTMIATAARRWRVLENQVRHSQRVAQLGVLAAGLAHELNNPASAGLRAAGQLQPLFDEVQDVRAALERLDLTAEQESLVADFAARARQSAGRPAALDSLARADREEALERWLAQHGFPDGWRVAPTLVDLALDDAALGRLAAAFNPAQLPIFLHWLQHDYETQLLLREIAQTTSRVADIVDALKSYVFLDQGPLQDLDVHDGLENALIVLSQKLAPAVTIRREYDPDLPKITAYGSELNQVWTSLIDNAIDALDGLDGQGRITLRTNRAPGGIIVEIEDNGPGIPPDHLPKIFDPFFTTKPPGQGAGLGLSMSYNIIAGKHHGNIVASSQPGRTLFRVELPSAP